MLTKHQVSNSYTSDYAIRVSVNENNSHKKLPINSNSNSHDHSVSEKKTAPNCQFCGKHHEEYEIQLPTFPKYKCEKCRRRFTHWDTYINHLKNQNCELSDPDSNSETETEETELTEQSNGNEKKTDTDVSVQGNSGSNLEHETAEESSRELENINTELQESRTDFTIDALEDNSGKTVADKKEAKDFSSQGNTPDLAPMQDYLVATKINSESTADGKYSRTVSNICKYRENINVLRMH